MILRSAFDSDQRRNELEFIRKIRESREASGSLIGSYSFDRSALRNYNHEERLKKLYAIPVIGQALELSSLQKASSSLAKREQIESAYQAYDLAATALKLFAEVSKSPELYMKLKSSETAVNGTPTINKIPPYSADRHSAQLPPSAFNFSRMHYAYPKPEKPMLSTATSTTTSIDAITTALKKILDEAENEKKKREKAYSVARF